VGKGRRRVVPGVIELSDGVLSHSEQEGLCGEKPTAQHRTLNRGGLLHRVSSCLPHMRGVTGKTHYLSYMP
jgi:hypothetical protein